MKEKIGLKIVQLIHDISRYGYSVEFSADFEGMLTIGYKEDNDTWYNHEHLGTPDGEMILLEKQIIQSLNFFLENLKSGKIKSQIIE